MKNIITLCFFALTLCFTTQTMNAQSLLEINTKANEKANELRKKIKFDDTTLEEVYQAYKAYETKIKSINTEMANDATEANKAKSETKEELHAKLKALFDEDQYERFLALKD